MRLTAKVIPFLSYFTIIGSCVSCVEDLTIDEYKDGVVNNEDIVTDDLNRQGITFNAIRGTIAILTEFVC
jgi:hypothetical protein